MMYMGPTNPLGFNAKPTTQPGHPLFLMIYVLGQHQEAFPRCLS